MARGTNKLNLDAKGRMAIPTKHRDALLRACNGQMVVTISPQDKCLWLYTLSDWEAVERKLVGLPTLNATTRKLKRMLIGHADDCDMDGSGRILLPGPLREYAMLQKQIVLIGQGDKFEIWDEALWLAHRESELEVDIDESQLPPELESLAF